MAQHDRNAGEGDSFRSSTLSLLSHSIQSSFDTHLVAPQAYKESTSFQISRCALNTPYKLIVYMQIPSDPINGGTMLPNITRQISCLALVYPSLEFIDHA